jgi:hypothetical protein
MEFGNLEDKMKRIMELKRKQLGDKYSNDDTIIERTLEEDSM